MAVNCNQTATFDNGKLSITKQDNAFEIKIDGIKMLVTYYDAECENDWGLKTCIQEYRGRSEKDGFVDGYVGVFVLNGSMDDLIKRKINKRIGVSISCFDCKGRDREWEYKYDDLK